MAQPYRFRPAFGQVKSLFRGARAATFPLINYVKEGRVLDLFKNFNSANTTIEDQSPEGNDATLYTGRYVSTDGVTDKAINADCSAAGSGNYYLTGKIKPVGTTAVANLNGSPITLTDLTDGAWQDFTSDTKTGITPDDVAVGWNGASNYSAADWSDVRLIDASDGSIVGRWQLTESEDGDLDGYPALDSITKLLSLTVDSIELAMTSFDGERAGYGDVAGDGIAWNDSAKQ